MAAEKVNVYYTIHNVMFSLHCAQPGPGWGPARADRRSSAGRINPLHSVQSGALTEKSRRDAEHIAAATVAGVSVLVSWNFRHMVNLWRIQRYNDVNRDAGYAPLDIRSPMDLENEE